MEKKRKIAENTTAWLLPWWVIKERKEHVFRSLLLNDIIGEIITNFTLGKEAKEVALRFVRSADLIWSGDNRASYFATWIVLWQTSISKYWVQLKKN